MLKGTIVLIPFPFTDLSGHKVRPALILSAEELREDCIVVFISSLKEKKLGAFDVAVKLSDKNGLKVDSVIKVSKIATLQKKIIIGEIGILEVSILIKIGSKLKALFQL